MEPEYRQYFSSRIIDNNTVPLSQLSIPNLSQVALILGRKADDKEFIKEFNFLKNYIVAHQKDPLKLETQRYCQTNFEGNPERLIPSLKTLACLAWDIERFQLSSLQSETASGSNRASNQPDGQDFKTIFARTKVSSYDDLKKWKSNFGIENGNCAQKHVLTALSLRAEVFLPDSFLEWDQITRAALRCLNRDDENFERINQRFALTHLHRNNQTIAKQFLRRALTAQNTEDAQRSLFWLGALEPQQPEHWQKLTLEYPLSLHAIIANHAQNKDPLDFFNQQPDVYVATRSTGENGWSEYDSIAFVFELLIAGQDLNAAKTWSQYVLKFYSPKEKERLLYLAYLYQHTNNPRASISMLSRYLRQSQMNGVSKHVLELLFPKLFANDILSHAEGVDPLIIFALIRQESAFDPKARSVANAQGLMQLLPSTARQVAKIRHPDLYHPASQYSAWIEISSFSYAKIPRQTRVCAGSL